MIEVKNVTKKFGDFTALQNTCFKVEDSSIYGLVGANGAGKTTLLKTAAGIYKPEEGAVLLFGENVFDNEKMKGKLFFIPDELYFLPQSNMKKMEKFYKGYYPNFSEKTYKKLTELFELDTSKRISGFSKGMQRQAEMIFAMSTHPEYIFLDESFDGLDPLKRSLFKQILLEYISETNVSIIISSHNLRELEDLCDHVGLIKDKKMMLDCSIEDMRKNRFKYRVAFDRDIEEKNFENLECRKFTKDGRIVTFIIDGNAEETQAKVKAMKPALMESVPLTLEEIFLDEMEEKDYDIAEIFTE